MSCKKAEWDESYSKYQNGLYYPENEIIRFVAKYIKQKIGPTEYKKKGKGVFKKGLDLGCGLGRNVFFLDDYEFESYGVDLSNIAIKMAKDLCKLNGKNHIAPNLIEGSSSDLPFDTDFFDFVISHGVLDSMDYATAQKSVLEAHRVIRADGLFYLDLIAANGISHPLEYAGQEIVKDEHEKSTIQSYFNFTKIQELLAGKFTILDAKKISSQSVTTTDVSIRWHIVTKKTA